MIAPMDEKALTVLVTAWLTDCEVGREVLARSGGSTLAALDGIYHLINAGVVKVTLLDGGEEIGIRIDPCYPPQPPRIRIRPPEGTAIMHLDAHRTAALVIAGRFSAPGQLDGRTSRRTALAATCSALPCAGGHGR